MDKRLFVGGLPFAMTDQQLGDLFSQVGTVVSAQVVIDRFSGRSKGFGFVEMTTPEEAQTAIQKLNETDVDGRKIVVNIAKPREERPQRDFQSGGGSRGGHNNDRRGGNGGGRGNRWN